jgi:hypothetical protein
MTDAELQAVVRGIAPIVREYVTKAVAELAGRMVLTEAQLGTAVELTKDLGSLRERLAVVEVRTPEPGPQGPPGPAGLDGKDGGAGLRYTGVYVYGKSYEVGDLVTWAGCSWHCNEATETKPGDGSKAWTLMVKCGRDGKDGRDGRDAVVPVVAVGSRT